MAFSLNKVQLIGNLGQDAETRFTQNNIPVTSFSIATTRSFEGTITDYEKIKDKDHSTLFDYKFRVNPSALRAKR